VGGVGAGGSAKPFLPGGGVADNGEGMTRDEAIAEITRRLVDYYRPERVYLFGSVARGDDGPSGAGADRRALREPSAEARINETDTQLSGLHVWSQRQR
jgi:hypothetical protein